MKDWTKTNYVIILSFVQVWYWAGADLLPTRRHPQLHGPQAGRRGAVDYPPPLAKSLIALHTHPWYTVITYTAGANKDIILYRSWLFSNIVSEDPYLIHTVCSRSLVQFLMNTHNTKKDNISWTFSMNDAEPWSRYDHVENAWS